MMKAILGFFLAMTMTMAAESPIETLLSRGLEPVVDPAPPEPETATPAPGAKPKPAAKKPALTREEQLAVIAQTAALLQKHLTFRADGSVSSYSSAMPARQMLEWKNLRIKMINTVAINDADSKAGVEKRFLAVLAWEGTRKWDSKLNGWSNWTSSGHQLFPTGIKVEWVNGQVKASGGDGLTKFAPGPGPSILDDKDATPGIIPSSKAGPQLPPGMSRGK